MSQGNIDVPTQAVPTQAQLAEACTVLEVLNRVSGKWSIGVLLETMHGAVRLTELERPINGISRRTRTSSLRNLERDGLPVRKVYPTFPHKVEYTATEMARELYSSVMELTGWAERQRATIAEAREAYDKAAVTT